MSYYVFSRFYVGHLAVNCLKSLIRLLIMNYLNIFFLTSDGQLLYFLEGLAMYIVDYLSNTLRSIKNFLFFRTSDKYYRNFVGLQLWIFSGALRFIISILCQASLWIIPMFRLPSDCKLAIYFVERLKVYFLDTFFGRFTLNILRISWHISRRFISLYCQSFPGECARYDM
jgi:hypothetical protein